MFFTLRGEHTNKIKANPEEHERKNPHAHKKSDGIQNGVRKVFLVKKEGKGICRDLGNVV
jgi:hypothetical protein